MWPKGKTIDDATVIGEQEGGMYKLKGQLEQALVHDSIDTSKLWHRRFAHCTIAHYLLQAKQFQDFQKSRQNMKAFARDVHKERT